MNYGGKCKCGLEVPRSVHLSFMEGARSHRDRASDSESRGPGFDPHRHHRVVSLSKTHLLPTILVKPRKRWLCPDITEKLLTGTLSQNTHKKKHLTFMNFGSDSTRLSVFKKVNLNHISFQFCHSSSLPQCSLPVITKFQIPSFANNRKLLEDDVT